MKKANVAKKMLKKFAKKGKGATVGTIEGDAAAHLGPQNKFSEKDEAKERRGRKEKGGKEPKHSWDI